MYATSDISRLLCCRGLRTEGFGKASSPAPGDWGQSKVSGAELDRSASSALVPSKNPSTISAWLPLHIFKFRTRSTNSPCSRTWMKVWVDKEQMCCIPAGFQAWKSVLHCAYNSVSALRCQHAERMHFYLFQFHNLTSQTCNVDSDLQSSKTAEREFADCALHRIAWM